jgi:exopolysaccharide biosynthesis polyprenyl glycosylphosphotransferase
MTYLKAWRQFRVGMIALDAATIVLTYILADILRCHIRMRTDWPELIPGYGSSVRIHLQVLALLPIGWPLILWWLGWYEQRWHSRRWHLKTALVGAAALAMLMAALALLFERLLYPRFQIGMVAILIPATTLAARGITGLAGRRMGSRQRRHVLIVGTSRGAVRLRRILRSVALGRPAVVGHLRGPWETDPARIETGAILGGIDRLASILDEQVVDEVIFSAPLEHVAAVLPQVRLCEEVGVTAHVLAESVTCHSVPELIDFHGVPLLTYSPARQRAELLVVKRAVDIAVAVIGIVLTAPIMLMCTALIRLTTPGPILFRQRRSGLNGREFRMFKFRTMAAGAEERLSEVAHLNESTGPVFKAEHDPRVTAAGRFLRRWSLDELPQLFNVLLGEMSIVGPRPPIPSEVVKYDRWQRRRLSMRPGLTCLWQIKGRHKISFEEWMRLDLSYIDNWSLKLDFRILCRTVLVVLGGTGA